MVFRADVDNRDVPAAASVCHMDSRGWTLAVAYCWWSLGAACVRMCVCIFALSYARGGMIEAKINGSVQTQSWRAPSSITGFLPLSAALVHAPRYASVCVCVPDTGKIESAAAVSYHRLTVLHFPYVSCCMPLLYTRCCCCGQCIILSAAASLKLILHILSSWEIRVMQIHSCVCAAVTVLLLYLYSAQLSALTRFLSF